MNLELLFSVQCTLSTILTKFPALPLGNLVFILHYALNNWEPKLSTDFALFCLFSFHVFEIFPRSNSYAICPPLTSSSWEVSKIGLLYPFKPNHGSINQTSKKP
jgi:hypothetical protein